MIEITKDKFEKIRSDFLNGKGEITEISVSSRDDDIFAEVSRINSGITEYKIVDNKMTLDDGCTVAVSEQEIEAHVYLLWELGKSNEEICDALFMTKDELFERPRIKQLLLGKRL